MTLGQRLFDLGLAGVLILLLWPLILGISLWILLRDGRPVFYRAERMKTPTQAFELVKFRTMCPDPGDSGVSGGDKFDRVTAAGRLLRRTRLDELPQLWNILRGDIRFVGPRPPLRQYVERFPDLYAEVLKARPGVTGLATVVMHGYEARVLSVCRTPEETDDVYCRRCIPRKARLDLLYAERASACGDLWILGRTLDRILRP